MMFKNIGDLQRMIQSAKEMQEKLQTELAAMRVEGSSGGGMVQVVLNGQKNMISIRLDPEVVNPADCEMLQDLILAAWSDAATKVDELVAAKLGTLGANLKIPGLF